MGKPWRFTFGLRALLALVTVMCVLLASWKQTVATRLWIEHDVIPTRNINTGYEGKAMVVHGRFFRHNGPRVAWVRWVVFHTAPAGESFSFKFSDLSEAEYESPGFYTFAIEIPAIGPRARADIGIRTSTGAAGQISLGNLSLPATAPTVDINPVFGF